MVRVLVSTQVECSDVLVKVNEQTSVYDADLSALLIPRGPGTPGAISYDGPVILLGDSEILRQPPALQNGMLQLQLQPGCGAGKMVTVQLTVSSTNYRPLQARLVFELTATRQISGVSAPNRVYSGQAYQPEGAPVAGGQPVSPARYHYTGLDTTYDSADPPRDAGRYRMEVFAPQDADILPLTLEFTIFRAPLTITPREEEMIAGQALPAQYQFDYDAFVGMDTAAAISPQPVARAEASSSAKPGVYTVNLTNQPQAKNYDISTRPGRLIIRERTGEESLYTVSAPGSGGWYAAPFTVSPARAELYNEIALSTDGPFSSQVVIEVEGDNAVTLYFRGNSGTASALFPNRLDMTAPIIGSVSCKGRTVTVTAGDALSGVSSVRLLDADGDEIAGANGVFFLSRSGFYTIVVTDLAGNAASAVHNLAIDSEEETDANGGDDDSGERQSSFLQSGSGKNNGSLSGSGVRDGYGTEDFWSAVTERVRAAQSGEIVRVMSATRGRIPASVLDALRTSGATLRLISSDGDTLLPGARIPTLDSEVFSYTLDDLLAMLLPVAEISPESEFDGPPQYISKSNSIAWVASANNVTPFLEEVEQAENDPAELPEEEPLPEECEQITPKPEIIPRETAAVIQTEHTMPAQNPGNNAPSIWPWILASLLGIGALALVVYAVKLHL